MITLINEDLHHVLVRLPRDVAKLMRKHPNILVLGGGFIRSVIAGEPINDIDLFGPSKVLLESIAKTFALERKGRLHETDNAFTVLTPNRQAVQFIHRWVYQDPNQLISDFDFTIAQAAVWWSGQNDVNGEWNSLVSDHYYPDLASRRLRYMAPKRHEDAGGSILRMRKFISRGYHIEANSLAKVVARLAMGVREIAEQNKEEALAKVMNGLLREVDPLSVIDGLELINEHQNISTIGLVDSSATPDDEEFKSEQS